MKRNGLRHFTLLCGAMMTVICQELLLHHAVRADESAPIAFEEGPILDDTTPKVIENEYVLSLAPAPLKRERIVEEIAAEVAAIEIQETSKATVLVSSDDRETTNDTIDRLCADLRVHRRHLLRTSVKFSRLKARIECDANLLFQASVTPSDPNFSLLWGMNQPSNIDIDAPEAWNKETGSDTTVVAVVDTGIDYTHPDLVENLWKNPGEIPGNGVDDDGNGYIDDVYGINAIENHGNPFDDNGHGTHCAGTIAARGNNGIGVVGVHWRAKIVSAKFLRSDGRGSLNDAVKSLNYIAALAERGVKIRVVNNSWGGGTYGYLYSLENAITRLNNAGVVFVAAAGNASNNNDANPILPANSPESNVVSVAALRSDGFLAYFSNYGATTVDIAAPGESIASTYPGNRYVWLSGTSMAAPHVSGAIALLASRNPNLSVDELISLIKNSKRSLKMLQGKVLTNGMLNIRTALSLLDGDPEGLPTPTPTPSISPSPTPTPPPGLPTSPTPTPQPRFLMGQVLSKDSLYGTTSSLGRAMIYISINGTTYSTKADDKGWYRLYDLPGSGTATVVVVRSGHAEYRETFDLSSPGYFNPVLIRKKYVLEVLVIDDSGDPIPGVVVTEAKHVITAKTNEHGIASFHLSYNSPFTTSAPATPIVTGRIYGSTRRVIALAE